jgi:hypothetical protein
MSSLAHVSPRVHSDFEVLPDRDPTPSEDLDDVEPFISPEDTFEPTPFEDTYWRAYRLTEDGENPDWPDVREGERTDLYHAFAFGRRAGTLQRERSEARELGWTLGYHSGICEPPPGFAPHQAEAYRAGFAEGELEFEEDREFEAWVISVEAERQEEAFSNALTDADIYPLGCVS